MSKFKQATLNGFLNLLVFMTGFKA